MTERNREQEKAVEIARHHGTPRSPRTMAAVGVGFAAAALALWATTAQPAFSQDGTAAPSKLSLQQNQPLQGQVHHEEKLPPIAPQYNVGNTLDPSELTALTPNNRWFQIPDWFAGKWHTDEQTILFLHEYATGMTINRPTPMKEVGDVTYGRQKDKTGHIWQFIKVPQTQKEEVSRGIAYLTSSAEDVIQVDASKIVLTMRYESITVNNKNKITDVKQIETINTYTPLDDGLIKLTASLKSFDAEGNAQVLQTGEKLLTKIAPYQTMDKDGDLDLKSMFVEFLKKSDQADLVP